MTTEAGIPEEFIRPRPGVAKTLGVLNLVIAVAMVAYISLSAIYTFMASHATVGRIDEQPPAANSPETPPVVGAPAGSIGVFGMDDPAFVRFVIVDSVTGLILNGLMFATGVGLVNLRAWAARWWTWVAWTKLVRLFLVWGVYIVAVAPSYSDRLARYFFATMPFHRGRGPRLAQMTRSLAVMNLIMAVAMIVFGSIYPAVSLWIIGRPGVRAALGRPAPPEGYPS